MASQISWAGAELAILKRAFQNRAFFTARRGKSSVTSVFWRAAACLQTCKYDFTIAINPIVQYSLEPIRF